MTTAPEPCPLHPDAPVGLVEVNRVQSHQTDLPPRIIEEPKCTVDGCPNG